MKKSLPLLLFLLPLALLAQTGTDRVLVSDLAKIKTVQAIAFSPDGQRAVYAVQGLEPHETDKLDYEYRTHLWLTDFNNPPRQLTRGKESVSKGLWADNNSLVFTRTVKEKSQLFLLRLDGGEPQQLTDWKYGASNPVLSPDGTKVVFSVSLPQADLLTDSLFNPNKAVPTWPTEKPGFASNDFLRVDKKIKANPDGSLAEIRAYLDQDVVDKKAKVFNRLNFQGESTTQPDFSFSHLVILNLVEGAKPRLLTTGFQSYGGVAWADNRHLMYSTGLNPDQHPDRELEAGLVIARLNAVNAIESDYALNELQRRQARATAPTPSPDGKWLAWLTSPSEGVNFPKLMLAELKLSNSGPPTLRNAAEVDFDRSPGNLTWAKDSRALYFTAASNGGVPLHRLETKSRKLERLTDFDSGVGDFDLTNNRLLFAKTEVANPSELYAADLSAKKQTRLSSHNLDWLKNKALSFPEKYLLANDKGQTVEYWIMKPTTVDAGKKYPLVLNMHGGPTAMWGPGEASMWHEFQFLCGKGYGSVYANPRGSGGYGLEFQRANIKDWGTGPASDVLAAASAAAREPWVDTSRQVITGGSYAGYLTAWIVAHDHRFKAAFAQRGVYDLTTFLGEGNAWRLIPGYFQYPWLDGQEHVLTGNSPYSFVQNIRTPLLIKHGENDLRTGPIQSEMMYKSLKILNRPVEYVRIPGATHELSRSGNPRQRIDRMLRIYEFFERYVGGGKDVR